MYFKWVHTVNIHTIFCPGTPINTPDSKRKHRNSIQPVPDSLESDRSDDSGVDSSEPIAENNEEIVTPKSGELQWHGYNEASLCFLGFFFVLYF